MKKLLLFLVSVGIFSLTASSSEEFVITDHKSILEPIDSHGGLTEPVAWSQSGRFLAYYRENIFLYDKEVGRVVGLKQLFDDSRMSDVKLAWSPTEDKLAISYRSPVGKFRIFVISFNNLNNVFNEYSLDETVWDKVELSYIANSYIANLSWSKDGRFLTAGIANYTQYLDGQLMQRSPSCDQVCITWEPALSVLPIESTQVPLWSLSRHWDWHVEWKPNGGILLLPKYDDLPSLRGLLFASLESISNTIDKMKKFYLEKCVGEKIVCSNSNWAGLYRDASDEKFIVIYDLNDKPLRSISVGACNIDFHSFGMDLSPDGKHIAYQYGDTICVESTQASPKVALKANSIAIGDIKMSPADSGSIFVQYFDTSGTLKNELIKTVPMQKLAVVKTMLRREYLAKK